MATVYLVLKVIGHILLILLAVVIVLLLLILFWPFCYDGSLTKHGEEIHARGRIFWLLHAVHASGKLDRTQGQELKKEGDVRIFGFSLLKHGKKQKSTGNDNDQGSVSPGGETTKKRGMSSGRRADGSAKKKPVVEPGQWKYMPDERTDRSKLKPGVYRQKKPNALERLTAGLAAWIGRLKKAMASLGQKLRKLNSWLAYICSDAFQKFLHLAIRHGGAILRHVLPGKADGYVVFGTGDPSKTGQILGVVASFCALLPKGLKITPDFQEEKLEADVRIKGHFFLIVVLVHALFIVLQKEFRNLMKRIRSEQNGASASENHKKHHRRQRQEAERAAA